MHKHWNIIIVQYFIQSVVKDKLTKVGGEITTFSVEQSRKVAGRIQQTINAIALQSVIIKILTERTAGLSIRIVTALQCKSKKIVFVDTPHVLCAKKNAV
jgi:hypothetical protein